MSTATSAKPAAKPAVKTSPSAVSEVEAAYSADLADARAFTAAHHAEIGSPFGLTPIEAVEHHERVIGLKKAYRRAHSDMLRAAERTRREDLRRVKGIERAAAKAAKKARKAAKRG